MCNGFNYDPLELINMQRVSTLVARVIVWLALGR